jgi:hypothetical protein
VKKKEKKTRRKKERKKEKHKMNDKKEAGRLGRLLLLMQVIRKLVSTGVSALCGTQRVP